LLSGAARRYGLDDAAAVGSVWRSWTEVVGPDVAAHAEPTSLRAGVLRIRADSPVWAHEIGYLVEDIKARLNSHLGKEAIEEIRIWSGPSKTAGAGSSAGPKGQRAGTSAGSSEDDPPDDPRAALDRARRAWQATREADR
jgi:predicted nucleic acid-binding Zn ribbon protein